MSFKAKRPGSRKLTRILIDPIEAYNAIADMLSLMQERGNLRFIRHAANLKLKFQSLHGPQYVQLTEKQDSTLRYCLERVSKQRDQYNRK